MSDRSRRLGPAAILSLVLLAQCGKDESPPAADFEAKVAREWMQLLHDRVRDDRRPPMHAARIYAYGSVALYEAVVDGMPDRRSLGRQLNDLQALPSADADQEHDWPSAAAGAASTVAAALFSASSASLAAITALKDAQLAERRTAGVDESVVQRSVEHGNRVGLRIVAWAATDGYAATRDRPYTPPVGPDKWVPTAPAFTAAVEPYWGELRPMVLTRADECQAAEPVAFSIEPGSEMYEQARQVYDAGKGLTQEQRDIATYWSDNPGTTGTPAGHWISIEIQMIDDRQLNLEQAVEMFALVAIGQNDAFIACWKEKYRVNLLRPITYIQRHIDPAWTPFVPTPAFPEYTSGHSTQSAAAAFALTELFGTVSFTDTYHTPAGLRTRSFSSFQDAADEAALSRLYGGIHYPMGNNNGKTAGRCVGEKVVERAQTRD